MLNSNRSYLQSSIILLCISALVACGGKAVTRPVAKTPAATQTTGAKPGGYYLDDGPGDHAPTDIDAIPDAVLKTETPLVRANKPYAALGQQYRPVTSYTPYKKQGVASWYGKRYHGKKTSTGEIYDMYAMSGAHTVLPIPSYAKVTNPANGRSVIIRINDRGPFKNDRLIDLSYAAAYKLRLIDQGSGLVEVEAIDTSVEAMQKLSAKQAQPILVKASASPPVIDTPPSLAMAIETPANIDNIQYYIQAGAFKSEANGELLQKKIQALQLAENAGIANVYNNGLFRVKLGPYSSKKEADASAKRIGQQLNISAIVQSQ